MLPRILVTPFRTATIWATLARQQIDWDKTSEIVPGLFLGSLPIRKSPCGTRKQFCNTLEQIKEFIQSKNSKISLSLIVSVIEPDELEGKGFWGVEPIAVTDLQRNQVERRILKMCDHDKKANVDIEDAIATLKIMHETIQSQKAVYVHCKAGCERSAMLCAIYVAAYVKKANSQENYTIEEAVKLLQHKRKQVTVAGEKLTRANEILAKMITKQLTEAKMPDIKKTIIKDSSYSHFWQKNKMVAVASMLTAGAIITASIARNY